MAKFPIEIIRIGQTYKDEIKQTVNLLNGMQKEFDIQIANPQLEEHFQIFNFREVFSDELLNKLVDHKRNIKGFHPFLIFIIHSKFKMPNYEDSSLFGEAEPREGIAVFTTYDVPDIIVPKEKIKSYFIYYIARYIFNFLFYDHLNHEETRDCVFDFKFKKTDLVKSMKANALCDDCRKVINNPNSIMSPSQLKCLDEMFAKSGELLNQDSEELELKIARPKVFIGSSVEGLEIARNIQSELEHDFEITIWNQGIFDKMGLSFLGALEEAVKTFDYGIFVFSPDDKIESRGESKSIARDNVIFELGMFVGNLSRFNSFIVHPRNENLHILTDFAGIIKADYDASNVNKQAALGPACNKIRKSILN